MRMVVLMSRCHYAPRKWALGHAFYSVLLGLCVEMKDQLRSVLSANTYLYYKYLLQ